MKKSLDTTFLALLALGALLAAPGALRAQTFTNLHSFTNGSDGANPVAGLILSGNTLYGTAQDGGDSRQGTVFAVNIDGTGFTILHSFTGSDGANPLAGLILSGNTLYGTTAFRGSSGNGTVFAVNTDGTGFTTLYSFTFATGSPYANSDGATPYAGLILSGNTLYGTASRGGSSGVGTVFALNTDGTGFTNLHSFTGSDGDEPVAGLILSGSTMYGTTRRGGSSGVGTVFAINTDGTGFTTLHNFTFSGSSDGINPVAGLILSGNTLYGTTESASSLGFGGTAFAVNTDGTNFAALHTFTGTGSDGANPDAGLILSGNNLYGTTLFGGSSGNGTVFSLSLPQTFSAQVQQPINPDGSSVFSVRRGVVPVKFTLTQGGVATCALPPATIALTRTFGGTIGAIDESVYSGSADTGSNFRISSCQYVYNLSAGALGEGTYSVDIVIDGQVVGSGSFQLK